MCSSRGPGCSSYNIGPVRFLPSPIMPPRLGPGPGEIARRSGQRKWKSKVSMSGGAEGAPPTQVLGGGDGAETGTGWGGGGAGRGEGQGQGQEA